MKDSEVDHEDCWLRIASFSVNNKL
jgi:hypothetical protein